MSHAPTSSHGHDDHNHGPHVRGSMDVSDQLATWHAFTKWAKWGTLGVMGLTFFLVFWLVGHIPLLASAAIIAIAVAALAWFFD